MDMKLGSKELAYKHHGIYVYLYHYAYGANIIEVSTYKDRHQKILLDTLSFENRALLFDKLNKKYIKLESYYQNSDTTQLYYYMVKFPYHHWINWGDPYP